MNKALNPTHIAPPYKNRYAHAIEVSAGSRLLFISGTVGVKPDGTVPAEFPAQVETVMQNLTEILAQKPAMTVVWVSGLADPRWMVEVDLVAAK